jgi:YHS domain-containing protein
MAKDPVCGMEIEESQAAGKSDYAGETYYFCSAHCKATFDKEPAKYAGEGDAGSEHHHHH